MRNVIKGLFKEKRSNVIETQLPIELSDEEMKGIEGASSNYLDHFYEKDRMKGILDPIYQKLI